MHSLSASFVLAYHGCERDIGEQLLLYKTLLSRVKIPMIGSVRAFTSGKLIQDAPMIGPFITFSEPKRKLDQ